MTTAKLSGIFVPNMVCYDGHGDVNEAETRRYIDWLIAKGVHGLYPNGSTGEFTRFTVEERKRIAEMVADQTAGRVPILAGAAEANVKETLKACEHAAELGVAAVAIVAPFYYKLGPESVYAYFAEIANNSPIDVTLYNIPMFASPIDVTTVRRLSEDCPRIIGIKDSSGDLPHMIRMIDAVRPNRPEFSFLTGWDAALMPMLLAGADGGTNASAGIVPELVTRLFDLTQSHQIEDARRLQYDIVRLFDAIVYHAEFPNGIRAAIELRGFQMGKGRMPQSETQAADLEVLRKTLQCLLAEHGFTNEPVGGCPVGDAAESDIAEIAEVISTVVTELQRRGMI
ncbi:dihydrodipicolinate synthase family protein [Stratiformator vulcanicus]|uniref:Putative 2-keto-3-deoxy-galactonate aldolase YagE n=1 Tax=Stratiformator vulcanicus TaxID=2527980 RepID=A0A517R4U7_9PLAN|nr:dihydrodipicolinate synthase family protein [Stratiformator vulcanicus]QDT38907.1 putative 2-keto-3-deoxy-galactonate aldolase YagE [Stratiformator vulcanicus]